MRKTIGIIGGGGPHLEPEVQRQLDELSSLQLPYLIDSLELMAEELCSQVYR